MINTLNIKQLVIWLLFILAQVLLAQNIVLYNMAFCFVYIGFILLLPIGISRNYLMLIGFFTGFVIDVFYNSLGTHMAASTLLCYLRPLWLNAITPRGGYENIEIPGVKDLSLSWFLAYSIPLSLIHFSVVFFVEVGGFHMFFFVILKAIGSTLLSVLVLIIVQYLFYPKGRYV